VDISYRWANRSDYTELGSVMFDAVRNGRTLYTEDQRAAWVDSPRSGSDWNARLSEQNIAIAQSGDQTVGFMSLAINGYIDFAYIRPEYQQSGIFRCLYNMIFDLATSQGESRLWTHASLMAQPAFSAMGFDKLKKETVSLNNQVFDRFEMELMVPE
jgi:putative acetyltransferase